MALGIRQEVFLSLAEQEWPCTQEHVPEMMEFDLQEEAVHSTIASALCSLASSVLREASCRVMKVLKQHSGGVPVART